MVYENWQVIMERFNSMVTNDYYSKIEYKTWRKLSKLERVDIWYQKAKNRVYIDNPDIAFESYEFACNDHSLGEFLFTFYPPEMKKEDIMNEKDIKNIDNNIENIDNLIKNTKYIFKDGKVYLDDLCVGDLNCSTATASSTDTAYDECLTATTYSDNTPTTYAITGSAIHTPEPVGISINGVASQNEVDDIRDNVNELIVQGTEMTDSLNAIWDMIDDIQFKLDCKLDIDHYNNNEKEKNKMKMFGNFEFGKVDGNTVRMSMYGLAVRNQAGTWVSYNPATNEVIDVDVMNFDGSDLMYKMPVAIDQVKVGDMVIHNRKPVYVTGIADGKLTAVDVVAGEEKIVLLTRNMFGFNFVTKVVSLLDMTGMTKPSAENPFGNMWMLALMGDSNDFDMKDMLMLSMMSGNASQMNPTMLMALMGDKSGDNKDMLMAMALSGMMNPTPAN